MSPEHRANILNTHYGHIGIGVVVSGSRVTMVEDFTNERVRAHGMKKDRHRPVFFRSVLARMEFTWKGTPRLRSKVRSTRD